MKPIAHESADLKQRLKHAPLTAALRAEAEIHTAEAEEAVWEVQEGLDTCSPGSYVAFAFGNTPKKERRS